MIEESDWIFVTTPRACAPRKMWWINKNKNKLVRSVYKYMQQCWLSDSVSHLSLRCCVTQHLAEIFHDAKLVFLFGKKYFPYIINNRLGPLNIGHHLHLISLIHWKTKKSCLDISYWEPPILPVLGAAFKVHIISGNYVL